MNKKYAIDGIVIVIIVAVAVFVLSKKNDDQKQLRENESASSEETMRNTDDAEIKTEDSFTEKILNMMDGGKTISCTYTSDGADESSVKTTVFMEGEKKYKMAIDTELAGKQYVLSDGNVMWSWNDSQKQGYVTDLSCIKELNKQSGDISEKSDIAEDYQYDSNDEIIAQDPDMKCEETSQIDFSLPKDITFTDQCALLKQSADMMEQIKKNGMQLPVVK